MNLLKRIVAIASAAMEWVSLKVSCLDRIDGVAVCDLTPTQPFKDTFLELTRQAMALIKSVDTRRYRRVCLYVRYISNTALLSKGQYGRWLKICRVDCERNFNSAQPLINVRQYAGTLVHEATHGLLFHKGIPYNKQNWERVERLCYSEAAPFARRVEPLNADLNRHPYNPEWHRQYWESPAEVKRQAWWKRFRDAFRLSFPKNARDHLQLGREYARKGDYDRAVATYSKALDLDPQLADAYVSRGMAYEKKRAYDKTLADYERAVQIDPWSLIARKYLAWLLATCPEIAFRDVTRAVEQATKACSLCEWKDPGAKRVLAVACGSAGDFKNAAKWMGQYLEIPNLTSMDRLAAQKRLALYQES